MITPKVLEFKHDEAQVRELRLAAQILNEQVSASTTLGTLLFAAAERIEWLSECVALNQRALREIEAKQ